MMENKLDGNAAGGMLQEVFPFEITTAEGSCNRCGATNQVGALSAYMHGMGVVMRCPECDNVLIHLVHAQGQYWLDMRGIRVLRFKSS